MRRGIFRLPQAGAALATLRLVGERMLFEFGPLGVVLGLLGCVALTRRSRAAALGAAWVFLVTLAYLLLLGPAVERSALMMHASMFAGDPPLVYFNPTTLAVMESVRALRARGTPAFFTMDAGPHVKVLTEPEAAESVASALRSTPGVERVVVSGSGPYVRLEAP